MDLSAYRASEREQSRINDLLELLPGAPGARVLEIGARDGYISRLLADRFDEVTALDLTRPDIDHPNVVPVQGDVTKLAFPDRSFDFVLCAEVLEHIPPDLLAAACNELMRVTRNSMVIGVPFRQDTRVGRTTCGACGGQNPCWGHVNSFDENRLRTLFVDFDGVQVHFVGKNRSATNFLSTWLMDLAGNPYGTYDQEEDCVICGAELLPPRDRTLVQKLCTKLSFWLQFAQNRFTPVKPNWIHMQFVRPG